MLTRLSLAILFLTPLALHAQGLDDPSIHDGPYPMLPQSLDPFDDPLQVRYVVDRREPVIFGIPPMPQREADRHTDTLVTEDGYFDFALHAPAFAGGARLAEISWRGPQIVLHRALVVGSITLTLQTSTTLGVSIIFEGASTGIQDAVYLGPVQATDGPTELSWMISAYNRYDQTIDDERRIVKAIRFHYPLRDPRLDYRSSRVAVRIVDMECTLIGAIEETPPTPAAELTPEIESDETEPTQPDGPTPPSGSVVPTPEAN